jgi:hypothetical protein
MSHDSPALSNVAFHLFHIVRGLFLLTIAILQVTRTADSNYAFGRLTMPPGRMQFRCCAASQL